MYGKIYRKWKRLLAEFRTSHLTLAEYCRQHNLNPKTAGRWKNIFLKDGAGKFDHSTDLELVPLNLPESFFRAQSSGVVLKLGELHIELEKDFDTQTLRSHVCIFQPPEKQCKTCCRVL